MTFSLVVSRESGAPPIRPPLIICLLGGFRLLKHDIPFRLRSGGKVEALLSSLALRHGHSVSRDVLLQILWPDSDPALSAQSLHTLVYSLHRALGDAIGGSPPVVRVDRTYRLNIEAGVSTDVVEFDRQVQAAEHLDRLNDVEQSARAYEAAVTLYTGDLCANTDIYAMLERERLRNRYLAALARLADMHFERGDYSGALNFALAVLVDDPCREDAHRLAMQCYVRRGERAQALRQYQLCAKILRAEFEAVPEGATTRLFDQIRTGLE